MPKRRLSSAIREQVRPALHRPLARAVAVLCLLMFGVSDLPGAVAERGVQRSLQAHSEPLATPSGLWIHTGSMTEARANHSLTLLQDGRVLAAGGRFGIDDTLIASAELYDPSTGQWSVTGSLAQARTSHTATLLENGKVLVAGGWQLNAPPLAMAELFDPSTGMWSMTGGFATGRWGHTATRLRDGKVLVVGGITSRVAASAEIYDPTTGTWTATGSLSVARYGHAAVLLSDGRVFVVGGYDGTSHWTGSAEIYDPATGTWRDAGSLASPRSNTTATLLRRGQVLVAGGFGGTIENEMELKSAELYDPIGGRWSSTGSLASTRIGPTATLLRTGHVLVAGGSKWVGALLTSAELYDPDAGQWSSAGNMLSARGGHAAALLQNGRVLVAGGAVSDSPDDVVTSAELYDVSLPPDTEPPIGSVTINGGAFATTVPTVTLALSATDQVGTVADMRLSADDVKWAAWQPYRTAAAFGLTGADGQKTVYAQFRDEVGNVSTPASARIQLDTAAGTSPVVSINSGALWSNSTGVTLTIGAPAGTAHMQISNDGGFREAVWQPFDTRPSWTITSLGSYVIPRTVYVRLRDLSGVVSVPFQDDIVYDPLPPTGAITVTASSSSTLQVTALATDADNISGVAAMRIGVAQTFSRTRWEAYATSKTITGIQAVSNILVYAQFRDGAGNVSRGICARPDQVRCDSFFYQAFAPMAVSAFRGW